MDMQNIIEKYTYRIEWSEEDQVFIAKCIEFPGLLAHGETNEEALKEIKVVVEESVKWLQEEGKEIPESLGKKNFKGKLTLRVPSEKHRELVLKSAEEGVSINQYILSKI
jgi:predicted RNase H-like HicB family nuclease